MASAQQEILDPQRSLRVDADSIATVFRPLIELHRSLKPRGNAAGEVPERDAGPQPSGSERNRTAQLLVAVSAMWDAVLVGAGIDLSAPLDRTLVETGPAWAFSGYADDMLTYQLCNSIWEWNELATARPTDDLDRMIARALVGIRDVMSALQRGMDIDKRSDEAMVNLILARPATVETMLDEARHRYLCPDIVELVVGSQSYAGSCHLEEIRNEERRHD